MIRIKRVYEPHESGDGSRFLVDRLLPRGMKKDNLQMDGWLKDAAPSDALRRWFGHVARIILKRRKCHAKMEMHHL